MPNLARVRTTWSGSPVVGTGVTTFYFDEAHSGFVADVAAFFVSLAARVPQVVTFTTLNTGDIIDEATGALVGTWTDGVTSTANSSGSGSFAAGVGVRGRWSTNGIRNGRRVRGSTFVVPLVGSAYQSDGTIDGTVWTGISNSFGALYTAGAGFQYVWSRPVAGAGGEAHLVIGSDVPDKVSWLRSRRT